VTTALNPDEKETLDCIIRRSVRDRVWGREMSRRINPFPEVVFLETEFGHTGLRLSTNNIGYKKKSSNCQLSHQ
jgi:hypothetical protein